MRTGVGEDIRHAPLLHHATVLDNSNVAADLLDHAHGVGDDDDRDARLPGDVAQEL